MKERPILFSGQMVRAILDGRKTVTRRVVKPQPPEGFGRAITMPISTETSWSNDEKHANWPGEPKHWLRCPYGTVGDRLIVRETWAPGPGCTYYRADYTERDPWPGKWKPSIHMPHSRSRLTLEITGVRVERLASITRGDCMAEGCPFPNIAKETDPVKWFSELWDDINGKSNQWHESPWVWVVSFRKLAGAA